MPKFRVGIPGILVGTASLFGGVLTILSITLRLLPALDDVRYFKEAIDLYADYVRLPLLRLTGLESASAPGFLADLLIFWIAFFAAVNLFTYRREGGLLAAHIRNNYCQYRERGMLVSFACVAPKLLVAFAAAPIVCTVYAATKFRAPKDRLYSAAFMTIQPREVLNYLLILFGITALVLLAAQQAVRFYE